MKKLFFLFAFMGFFAFASNAQTKSCASSKKSCAKTCMKSSMAKAAADDESIVKQVSDKGDVSYVRKEVCPMSGKVTMKQVEYCSKSAKFVNVSPTGAKQACSKKASATKVSSTSKKACSGQKAASKACCKKGAKACSKKASTQKAAAPAKAKMVKGEASSH